MGWWGAGAIYNQEHADGWKLVTDAVHEKGSVIFCQLWHMGRTTHSAFHGLQPVSASDIKVEGEAAIGNGVKAPYETPRALATDEIPGVVDEYVNAARIAKEAGFDGVEIHGANGYLLDQFLQTVSNKRTDIYGGSVENRFRIYREVIEAVSTVFPLERIGVRLSPNGAFNGQGSEDNFETFSFAIEELNKIGIGYLHVMDGLAFGFHGKSKQYRLFDVRKRFDGPIIGNCGYTQGTAEGAIRTGTVDMIAFGRPYLSNPDLVERFTNGWPLAEPAPFPTWYTYPDIDPSIGYTDFPPYSPPAEGK